VSAQFFDGEQQIKEQRFLVSSAFLWHQGKSVLFSSYISRSLFLQMCTFVREIVFHSRLIVFSCCNALREPGQTFVQLFNP